MHSGPEHTSFNAPWFIGLLVVFMAALAVTAAIGIMWVFVVFVVFGLNFLQARHQPPPRPPGSTGTV